MKVTVAQLVASRPYMTEPAVRWLLFNRVQNGLNKAVVKIGKKVLIDEESFDSWVEEHREVA